MPFHARTKLALVGALAFAAACQDSVATAPADIRSPLAPSATVIAGVPGDMSQSTTASGPLTNGDLSQVNLTISNAGTQSYGDTVFAWVLLPPNIKRQVDAPLPGANPRIQCEAYRGTQGGLSKSIWNDWCRIWFTTGVPAGGSVTAVIPFKALAEGDYTLMAGSQVKRFGIYTALELDTLVLHIAPAVAGGGGGGGGGSTTAEPDLQAGARSSTGSPAAGSGFVLSLTAKNSGKGDAAQPTLVATLPAGVTATLATFDYGSCTIAGQVVTCTSPDAILAGAMGTVTISAIAPSTAGSYTIGSRWSVANTETVTSNNAASVSITVK